MSEDSTTDTSGTRPPEQADLDTASPSLAAPKMQGPSLARHTAAARCAEEFSVTFTVGDIFMAEETDLGRARASTERPCLATSIEELHRLKIQQVSIPRA